MPTQQQYLVMRGYSTRVWNQNYVLNYATREYLLSRKAPTFWLYIDQENLHYFHAATAEALFAKIDSNDHDGIVFDDKSYNIFGEVFSDHISWMSTGKARTVDMNKGVICIASGR